MHVPEEPPSTLHAERSLTSPIRLSAVTVGPIAREHGPCVSRKAPEMRDALFEASVFWGWLARQQGITQQSSEQYFEQI